MTGMSAADELDRLNEIGNTRRDLISDEDWEWFTSHPLKRAPYVWSEAIPLLASWLRDRDDAAVAAALAPIEALADSIHGETGVEHNEGCAGEPDCLACILADLRAALAGGGDRG